MKTKIKRAVESRERVKAGNAIRKPLVGARTKRVIPVVTPSVMYLWLKSRGRKPL